MRLCHAIALVVLLGTSLVSAVASAHTVEICWRNEPDGSTTFYAGTYHANPDVIGGIIVDGTTYDFTESSTYLPPDISGCQPVSCSAFISALYWQRVNVADVQASMCSVTTTCTSDHECPWPACFPQALDLEPCADADADGMCDDYDNCPGAMNPDQADSDFDGAGDACDCAGIDDDFDGICDDVDNCLWYTNPDQADSDGDGLGDVCDCADGDLDGVCDDFDSCVGLANPDQADADSDGLGDACDACANDPDDDDDDDGVCGDVDLCPGTALPEQVPTVRLNTNRFADVDGDGVFDTTPPSGKGPRRSYTLDDTGGCSCAQIIDELQLGEGHVKFGCSIGAMDQWVSLVQD